MTERRIVATIEARMTSSRLPGKVLKEVVGKPLLQLMIERLRRAPSIDEVVIATTVNATDDALVDLAGRLGFGVFRGSEDDVLVRVLDAARAFDAEIIVETTGDCPLIDPALVELCIQGYLEAGVDYVSNVLKRTYPRGMDAQVFATNVLADVAARTIGLDDHEHVSLYIYSHPEMYSLKNMPGPPELTDPGLGLTLDTAEDLAMISKIFEALYAENPHFGLADVMTYLDGNPDVRKLNDHVQRKHA